MDRATELAAANATAAQMTWIILLGAIAIIAFWTFIHMVHQVKWCPWVRVRAQLIDEQLHADTAEQHQRHVRGRRVEGRG